MISHRGKVPQRSTATVPRALQRLASLCAGSPGHCYPPCCRWPRDQAPHRGLYRGRRSRAGAVEVGGDGRWVDRVLGVVRSCVGWLVGRHGGRGVASCDEVHACGGCGCSVGGRGRAGGRVVSLCGGRCGCCGSRGGVDSAGSRCVGIPGIHPGCSAGGSTSSSVSGCRADSHGRRRPLRPARDRLCTGTTASVPTRLEHHPWHPQLHAAPGHSELRGRRARKHKAGVLPGQPADLHASTHACTYYSHRPLLATAQIAPPRGGPGSRLTHAAGSPQTHGHTNACCTAGDCVA